MDIVKKDQVEKIKLPGRIIQKAIGFDGLVKSKNIIAGFAHYSAENGTMEPHKHAEEVVYVLKTVKGWIRYGMSKNDPFGRKDLEPGMLLYFCENEWHVFEYDLGGYIDIIFFYGQLKNIRPEDENL